MKYLNMTGLIVLSMNFAKYDKYEGYIDGCNIMFWWHESGVLLVDIKMENVGYQYWYSNLGLIYDY